MAWFHLRKAMNTWTPLWSKIVDSSIWTESLQVRILFVTMLALKDRDHVVRRNPFELARRANLTEDEVVLALKVLESPDTKRKEPQDYDGRRIKKVEDGWLMLNGDKYRRMMQMCYRREYKAVKQAEYRDKNDEPTTEDQPELTAVNEPQDWKPTELQLRLGALFKRKPTTQWSKAELKAFKSIGRVATEDLCLLETYYTANFPQDKDYRRRDLSTLLNNLNGEIDRARQYKPPECF